MKSVLRVLGLGLLACACLAGCGGDKADTGNPTSYTKDGLSLEMPGNWRVTEDERVGDIRYLFVEEPGDAVVILQFFPLDQALDLRAYAENFAKQAKASTDVGSLSASSFGSVGQAGGFETLRETFSMSLLGQKIPHTRDYRRKVFGEEVCFLVAQVANEDRSLVAAGFKQVMRSLKYERP